ncbi:hypothetical protein CDV26_08190 [Francisella halioticida]|uniref:Methyltransferase n=2 Tax=Francisella halioticida TaxID=549298 RepID=A0ABM6M0M5_9GAMM|nr:hypothetical protein CDV26_08190 [Francisella halioticida]
MVPTQNKTGSMFIDIVCVSKDFIKDAKESIYPILDLGCAYGIVTLKCLDKNVKSIIAFDMEETFRFFATENSFLWK